MSLTDRVRDLKHLLGKLLPRTVSKGRKADEEPSQEVMTRDFVLCNIRTYIVGCAPHVWRPSCRRA